MKSLSYLNNFNSTKSFDVTDLRPSGIVFDRKVPPSVRDNVLTITYPLTTIVPDINIKEIINYETANVRYKIKIVTDPDNPLPTSTLNWPSGIPQSVTLTQEGDTYTFTGINSTTQWDAIKIFDWVLPSDYANYPLWYLEVSIIYFNSSLVQDVSTNWFAYDPRFFWVAQLESSFSVSGLENTKARLFNCNMTATTSQPPSESIVLKGAGIKTDLQFTSTLTATGEVNATQLNAISSLDCKITVNYRPSLNFAAIATASPTANYKVQFKSNQQVTSSLYCRHNDMAFQIRHDATRTNLTINMVINYDWNNTTVVDWGDGTTTSYNFADDIPQNISHTYSGSGYKEVTIYTKGQILRFVPTPPTATSCLITRMYEYGQKLSWYNDDINLLNEAFVNQTELIEVPKYLPPLCTLLTGTFKGCTSFNDSNVKSWDTSSIKNMQETFYGAASFDQDISNWNTSSCTNMTNMFYDATSFNQDLNSWDVNQVSNYSGFDTGAIAWFKPHPWMTNRTGVQFTNVYDREYKKFINAGVTLGQQVRYRLWGYEPWVSGEGYYPGDVVKVGNKYYINKQTHSSNSTNTPPSLYWQEYYEENDWSPLTSYTSGDLVFHNNQSYTTLKTHISSSIFPTLYWKPISSPWLANKRYEIGDTVTYGYYIYNSSGNNTNKPPSYNMSDWSVVGQGKEGDYDFWDKTSNYLLGDRVLYGLVTYVCSWAHTSTSTFDISNWMIMDMRWDPSTNYAANNLVLVDSTDDYNSQLYKCLIAHTSASQFPYPEFVLGNAYSPPSILDNLPSDDNQYTVRITVVNPSGGDSPGTFGAKSLVIPTVQYTYTGAKQQINQQLSQLFFYRYTAYDWVDPMKYTISVYQPAYPYSPWVSETGVIDVVPVNL